MLPFGGNHAPCSAIRAWDYPAAAVNPAVYSERGHLAKNPLAWRASGALSFVPLRPYVEKIGKNG